MTFEEAIREAGFEPPPGGCVLDGKLRRFPSDSNRRHSKDAWYVGFDDRQGCAGAFGSWRDGATHKWSNGTGRQLTTEELFSIQAQREAARKKAQAEANVAAQRAQRIFAAAAETGESAYLAKKNIRTPDGVRFVKNLDATAFGFEKSWKISGILVPMRNLKGDIRSLQIIADGVDKKLFMPDGQTMGLFHVLGGTLEGAKRIVIAEGIATAQSCHESTGCVVVCAFSAGNLERTAIVARSLNATAEIILAADGDKIGREQAQIAASAVNGRIIVAPEGQDFNDVPLHLEEANDAQWRAHLIVKTLDDGTQKIPCRTHNLILILHHADEFRSRIALDAFSQAVAIDDKPLSDAMLARLKAQLEKNWITERIPSPDIMEALAAVAERRSCHPVKDYLNRLSWDGVERINYFFPDFLGSPNDEYHQAASRCLFLAAVARIFTPGCKVDLVTILEGSQGIGKSSLWKALSAPWYADITASINDKDFLTGLRGIWFADLGELDQLGKAENSRIKQVITVDIDHYRPHYGRMHQAVPRQNIFVGGTNRDDWANDPTGARRFIPVKCHQTIDIQAVEAKRDQLWAEAVVRFKRGEDWWLIPDALCHQEERYQEDPWQQPIHGWLLGRHETTSTEILDKCLGIELGRQTRHDMTRVGNVMMRVGWKKRRVRMGKGLAWRYFNE
ncbi:Toprim domain-containing protein [Gammaproteobacteria bacterium]